jgi:acyl-CoA reductase-like NAD-dependent aldehyde dehydrogenase
MWIAGAELRGDGSPEVVRNPATEEALADVPSASPDQVDRAERKPWWYPYGQQG